jgi:hypothetical protein
MCSTAGAIRTPGGNPVTEVPGYNPRFPPEITVGPELVTVDAPKTSKLAAELNCESSVAINFSPFLSA